MPFLDRASPQAVAKQAVLPEDAVEDAGEQPRTAMERLVAALGRTSTVTGRIGRPNCSDRERHRPAQEDDLTVLRTVATILWVPVYATCNGGLSQKNLNGRWA
ncbi:MAG TPA: hypothetical protein VFQ68_22160 [Streptosporangiaceae bacterium]|nr:hypothetical protein [Streptosporangiaceae bacterium]